MARLWGSPGIAPDPGLASTELVEALETRRIKVVWIVATNPVVSQPDAGRFAAALRRADLVICQDAYFPTETGALAHMMPAGRAVAGEGRHDDELRAPCLARAARARPARRGAARLGHLRARRPRARPRHGVPVAHGGGRARRVRADDGRRLCDQSGISHTRLRREGPLQWPCPAPDHAGTERLYTSRRFATPDGRARLAATPHTPPADPVDADFPLVLTTGRVAQQWHTMTRTGKSPELLAAEPHPFVEMHPSDAGGFEDGQKVRRALAARFGRAAAAGERRRAARGRVRAVPLGRTAPRARRGRASTPSPRRTSTRSRASRS